MVADELHNTDYFLAVHLDMTFDVSEVQMKRYVKVAGGSSELANIFEHHMLGRAPRRGLP